MPTVERGNETQHLVRLVLHVFRPSHETSNSEFQRARDGRSGRANPQSFSLALRQKTFAGEQRDSASPQFAGKIIVGIDREPLFDPGKADRKKR